MHLRLAPCAIVIRFRERHVRVTRQRVADMVDAVDSVLVGGDVDGEGEFGAARGSEEAVAEAVLGGALG